MENDEITPDLELDANNNQEENDENQTQNQDDDTSHEDDKDWKSEALKYKAILNRNKNKPEKKTSEKSGELDYGQKAFLVSNGIKGAEENELVKSFMKETGKSLDDVLESRYFQEELKDLREKKATDNATIKSSKRSNQSSQNEVDYWINKGELPPATEVELRRKVVNERIKRETKTNIFL